MTSSLVGSEMCIRDRSCTADRTEEKEQPEADVPAWCEGRKSLSELQWNCLLYTSDAADDM
eukprot:8135719-Prorocentrum_lima.AAC.1